MSSSSIARRQPAWFYLVFAGGFVLAAVLLSVGWPLPSQAQASAQAGNSFAVANVRVFDGKRLIRHADVVVRDGEIRAVGTDLEIPAGLKVYNGEGKTLLPGLIDAHVHTWGSSRQGALRFGVTTELDMFTDWNLLAVAKEQRGAVARTDKADLWSAGMLATVAGGHGTEYPVKVETLSDPAEADEWVAKRLREGSDYIKIIVDDGTLWGTSLPTLKPATVKALVEGAHTHGRMAIAHVATLAGAKLVVDAGVDGLAHVFADATAAPEFIRRLKQADRFVIATLSVYDSAACAGEARKLMGDPKVKPYLSAQQLRTLRRSFSICHPGILEIAMANVRLLHAAGIPVLAGTDAGNPGTAHGVSLHGELRLLVEAGLTPAEALNAATALPAEVFGLGGRGRVAPGLRADLLLVSGNPLEDITATRNIAAIWMNGYRVERKPAHPSVPKGDVSPAPAAPSAPLVSDFERGEVTSRFGSGWQITTDRMRGGQSTASMALVEEGAEGSAGALRVTGEVSDGFMYPWAGVMFFPGETPMAPVDFSGGRVLTFRMRGDGGTYTVMLFSGARHTARPAMRHFTTGSDWQRVVMPLSRFNGADPAYLRGIAFTAGPGRGPFHFSIDDVAIRVADDVDDEDPKNRSKP